MKHKPEKPIINFTPCDQHVSLGQSGHHNSAIIYYQPPRKTPEEAVRLMDTIISAQHELIQLYQQTEN